MAGFSNDAFDSNAFDSNAFDLDGALSFDGDAFDINAFDINAFDISDPSIAPPVPGDGDIKPLCVATDGYLAGNTLAVASNGYLCVGVIVFVKKDGSGSARAVEVQGYKLTAAQIEQLKREDEEVVAIISVIGEHLL